MISCLMDLSHCTPESVSRRKALAAALRQLRILSAEEEEEFAISCASVGGRKEAGDEVRDPFEPDVSHQLFHQFFLRLYDLQCRFVEGGCLVSAFWWI